MIQFSIKIGETILPLKSLQTGENGSITDYSNEQPEIIVVRCTNNGGEVYITKQPYIAEYGFISILDTNTFELERKFIGEYRRNIKTKMGIGEIILKYFNPSDN